MIISQLVRNSCRASAVRALERVLGQGEVSAAELPALQAAFAADAEEPLLLYGLKGERAGWDRVMGSMASGQVPLKSVLGPDPPERYRRFGDEVGWWMTREHIPYERAFLLRGLTGAVESARRPAHEQAAAIAAVVKSPANKDLLWAPGWLVLSVSVRDSFWRGTAEARCAAVALACERHRLNTGRWPDSLADLATGVLPGMPLDPFDGQPLRYRRAEDRVTVYSVGPDKTDDGGNVARNYPERGTDLGFELWDADRRRLPPPAKPPDDPGAPFAEPEAAPPPREKMP